MAAGMRAKGVAYVAMAWVVLALAACGGDDDSSGDPVAPGGTTLDRSLTVALQPTFKGTVGGYSKIFETSGWPIVVRTDLAPAFPNRAQTRNALVAFAHLTDVHIIDGQSPLRAPFLRKFGTGLMPGTVDLSIAYRTQDQFGTYVTEAMIQQLNSIGVGPVTGRPFDFAVSTGDDGDGKQFNELHNFINLFDGAQVTTNSSGQGYVGVEDNFIFMPTGMMPPDEGLKIYAQYWHPEPPPAGVPPDDFKTKYGYPEYCGLLEAATENFQATGIDVPWYSGFGNHDGLLQGNVPLNSVSRLFFDGLATGTLPLFGSKMLLDIPPGFPPLMYLECLIEPTTECIEIILFGSPTRTIPANTERVTYTSQDFIKLHLESPPSPGPRGHGFTDANLANGTLYYSFPLAPGILGIMLDTVNKGGGGNGSIDAAQLEWLVGELCAVQKNPCLSPCMLPDGSCPAVKDELVVLFSHHNLLTMNNPIPDPGSMIPRFENDQVEEVIHLFPNVVLWVNGHSHFTRVWAHPDPTGAFGGFWEVTTPSHIDYPQMSRTIEIVDNKDGTLSIFGVMVDHAGYAQTTAGNCADPTPFGVLDIASVSRELSANDPGFIDAFQLGTRGDNNVELLINKPPGVQFP